MYAISSQLTALMSFKRFVFCLLVITVFIDVCQSQGTKKGKKNKGKKNQKAAKNKNKGKNKNKKTKMELDYRGLPLINAAKLKPYHMKEKGYWSEAGNQRTYRLEDSPEHNPEFMALYAEMRGTIFSEGETADNSEPAFLSQKAQEKHFLVHRQMVENLHVIKTYYLEMRSGYVSTVFAAHLDTRNGTDLPIIFLKNEECSMDYCMRPTWKTDRYGGYPLNEVPLFAESDYFIPKEEDPVGKLTEEHLTKIEHMLNTYTVNEVRKMLCHVDRLSSVRHWLSAKISPLELRMEEFLANPGLSDPTKSDKNLRDTHNTLNGYMLIDFFNNFCK